MTIDQKDILAWDAKYRLKFIDSISGYKSVHLVGTKSNAGINNLGTFNSVVHISSNPPQLGFIIQSRTAARTTYNNIVETGCFTINHVHKSILKQAHYTSVNLEEQQSEFKTCNLKDTFLRDFKAPFVEESLVQLGLKLVDDIELKPNGAHLIIGEIELIKTNDEFIKMDGQIDLEQAQDVCVSGINQYSSVRKFVRYPNAQAEDMPDFYAKERADSVVFDKTTQSYNSNLLPYGTNISAPSINPTGVSSWKNRSIGSFNHAFNNKIEKIKDNYQKLIDEYQTNEMLYNAKMGFEPIIGKTYHLYAKENTEEWFLSLIPPISWDRKHLGSYKLNSDKVWEEIEIDVNE